MVFNEFNTSELLWNKTAFIITNHDQFAQVSTFTSATRRKVILQQLIRFIRKSIYFSASVLIEFNNLCKGLDIWSSLHNLISKWDVVVDSRLGMFLMQLDVMYHQVQQSGLHCQESDTIFLSKRFNLAIRNISSKTPKVITLDVRSALQTIHHQIRKHTECTLSIVVQGLTIKINDESLFTGRAWS